jgi:hypothetical protein
MASPTFVQKSPAANLLAILKQSEPSAAEITLGFRRLHRLVESLPLTTDEFSFVHNWLTSAQQL